MYTQESFICYMWFTVWVFVCLKFLPCVSTNKVGFQCPWPAFNCQVDENQQSFPLSRELRATKDVSSQCSNVQWACRTGQQCIVAAYRCNGIVDCKDESDELGCQGVGYKASFNKASAMLKSEEVVNVATNTRNSGKDNCTSRSGPAQERFCRQRYRGYYKHKFDCEKYVVCEWGSYYECQCPPSTRWDMRLVTCIWKFMSPCFSSDPSLTNESSVMHPSQIARLIELYAVNSRRSQQTVVRPQISTTPRMRKVNQIQPGQLGNSGHGQNGKSDQIGTQYDGSVFGSVVQ